MCVTVRGFDYEESKPIFSISLFDVVILIINYIRIGLQEKIDQAISQTAFKPVSKIKIFHRINSGPKKKMAHIFCLFPVSSRCLVWHSCSVTLPQMESNHGRQ